MKLRQDLLRHLLLLRGSRGTVSDMHADRIQVTHLLASAGVEGHDHSVHERDIELFGEVEYALMHLGEYRVRGKRDEMKRLPPWWQCYRWTRAVVVVVVVGVEPC